MTKTFIDYLKLVNHELTSKQLLRIANRCKKLLKKEMKDASSEHLFFLVSRVNRYGVEASVLDRYLEVPLCDMIVTEIMCKDYLGYLQQKVQNSIESGNDIQLEYLQHEYSNHLYDDVIFKKQENLD